MTYFQILTRIFKDFKKYIGNTKFFFLIFVLILTTFLWSLEAFFGAKMIQYIEEYFQNNTLFINEILIFLCIYVIYIIFNSILRYYYRYYLVGIHSLKYYTYHALTYKEKVLYMSEFAYLNKKSGSIYKTFDRWVEGVFDLLMNILNDIWISLISIIWLTIVMFIINPVMAITSLGLVPVMLFMWFYYNKNTHKYQSDIHNKWILFYSKLSDYLSNLTLVKTLTLEQQASKELHTIQYEALDLQYPVSKRWALADVYVQFLVNLSRFLVLWVGLYFISVWKITFAEIFLFFSLIGFIYYPMSFLFGQLKNIQKLLEEIKKFYETFDTIEQDFEYEKWKEIEKISGKITFENVDFKYLAEWEDVIKNLSFSIQSGEKVALVGSTWSGKTTITKLILRLFEINKWKILIDNSDISTLKKSSLRSHIWIVMQDNSLFNTTIKENMLFAKPDATDEEITQALKKAKADFVLKQEKWILTEIWERWLKLSGWEKQRINIARIFLKNPEILILDEATSALDNKTEIEIQQSLDDLMQGKTSLIIAHRLSTIKKVDKIFVLENGKIVEMWNYEELIEKKWKFFELANPDKLIIN